MYSKNRLITRYDNKILGAVSYYFDMYRRKNKYPFEFFEDLGYVLIPPIISVNLYKTVNLTLYFANLIER